MPLKKAVLWTLFWFGMAGAFNIFIYLQKGFDKAFEFFGGYVIELSLSLDNLFLFVIIFGSFGVKPEFQRRVLNFGIMGAVILRLIFVILGVAAVERFHWLLGVFGLILVFSGLKIMVTENIETNDYKNSLIVRVLRTFIPITDTISGQKFFVRISGVLHATPLLAILVLIEASDIIFAIDSIPAIFSITTDSFIVYTSNLFAVMGLRNIYFLLEQLERSFRFVKAGVALILVFTGVKLLLVAKLRFSLPWFEIKTLYVNIPILLSIAIIVTILGLSVGLSVIFKGRNRENHFCDVSGAKTHK